MGNVVGTQCPPWGGQMATAVRDAYEVGSVVLWLAKLSF